MNDLNLLFTLPFMQRALIGGLLVALLTSWMGILVVLKRSSFFGDAIAHASLTGVALGLLLGLNPIVVAVIYAVFVSFLLPILQRRSNLPLDSLLGFILPFSMAIGVILLSILPGYQPELISFLFGSVLSISWTDIFAIGAFSIAALLTMAFLKKALIFTAFDEEYAKVSGINTARINSIYHILLAITIVAGVKLVGIVLVNALLVIPASIARIFANSLNQMLIFTPIIAIVTTITGVLLSYFLNIPTGPTIAAVSGILFLTSLGLKKSF